MYFLSRWLLIIAAIAGVYSLLLVVALFWPNSAVLLLIVGYFFASRRRIGRLTTLGSARWADEDDLREAGMLDASSGLILGQLPADLASRRGSPVSNLFDRQLNPQEACEQFWSSSGKSPAPLVRLQNAIHTSVFAPSGAGKGVSFVIPFLLTCPDSCVIIDFKGENAILTSTWRREKFGHRVVLMDPFQVVSKVPDQFNPLDFIDKQSPLAIDDCHDLAKALILRNAEEKEPHWNDSAEAWLSALIATVVQYG